MTVLISKEAIDSEEIKTVIHFFEEGLDFRFHLRKQKASPEEIEQILESIPSQFHSKISVHLNDTRPIKNSLVKLHCKESLRFSGDLIYHSTSFHNKFDCEEFGLDYQYFFCSPVFTSISKLGYSSSEDWNIRSWANDLQFKAVALGGVCFENLQEVRNKGFKKIAVLGAIWGSPNPQTAFKEILRKWESIVRIA
jgi:thiamine-phosphate pyrophosphorylase